MNLPPELAYLQNRKIFLASASPRRREILTQLGLVFEVVPSTFPELLDKSLFKTPADYAMENAKQKGLEVYQRHHGSENQPDVVISADSIVVCDGRILEKPDNRQEAIEMMKLLSGKGHQVISAVSITSSSDSITSFYDTTEVEFVELSDSLIEWYVATGDPFDKAGGYGYQSKGMVLVKSISGCYYNIVGFPVHKFLHGSKNMRQ